MIYILCGYVTTFPFAQGIVEPAAGGQFDVAQETPPAGASYGAGTSSGSLVTVRRFPENPEPGDLYIDPSGRAFRFQAVGPNAAPPALPRAMRGQWCQQRPYTPPVDPRIVELQAATAAAVRRAQSGWQACAGCTLIAHETDNLSLVG